MFLSYIYVSFSFSLFLPLLLESMKKYQTNPWVRIKKQNKFSLKQLQISLNVQLAEKLTVSQYTINISVTYIPNIENDGWKY